MQDTKKRKTSCLSTIVDREKMTRRGKVLREVEKEEKKEEKKDRS